ncbi:trafficking protein particle complex subunit 6B-like [Fagus crenata]
MGREVSESCVDSLLTEMVSSYCDRFYTNKPELAARQIEAIGFQGTFVLQDNRFRWLARTSIDPSPEKEDLAQDNSPAESKSAQATSMHLYFPCGIIRGALQNLGIPCAVTADISNLPASHLPQLLFASMNSSFVLQFKKKKKMI